MPDEDKVGHLLKGIAEDVYNFLITKESLTSPADVIRHCRAFEAFKIRRISPKFGRLPNVPTVASVDTTYSEDIASMVRRIIREELQHTGGFSRDPEYRSSPTSTPVYHQCSVQPPPLFCQPPRRTPHDYPVHCNNAGEDQVTVAAFTPGPPPVGYNREPRRTSPRFTPTPQYYAQPDVYREPPVCYNCGVSGHIARFCRQRPQLPPRFANRAFMGPRDNVRYQRDNVRYRPDRYRPDISPHRGPQPSVDRNNSPVSDRSITPPPTRQGRSPSPRRRFPSPPLGN